MSLSLAILFAMHWVADFPFQTTWMRQQKHQDWVPLTAHVLVYTAILSAPVIWYSTLLRGEVAVGAIAVIALTHYAIDAVTSRISKSLFAEGRMNRGFDTVGADQCLHYLVLAFVWVKWL